MAKSLPPLAVIAGPTASGKSALALALAKATNGVIINADSAQIYADLHIVAATPSEAEQAEAPHRLYGVRDGALPCSAADWAALARHEIETAHVAGRLPILVGGTGLYILTLLDGIAPVPPIDAAIRKQVRAASVEENYARLQQEDPEAATRLNPGDTTRIARALEVTLSTGRTLKSWQSAKEGGIGAAHRIHAMILLPPRDWLNQRCDQRFSQMIEHGALEEVEALLARKLDPALPVMRAIGVPEIAAYLRGETSRDEMIAAGQLATRQYAKRQYTWFRNQPPADWHRFERPLDEPGALAEAVAMLAHDL